MKPVSSVCGLLAAVVFTASVAFVASAQTTGQKSEGLAISSMAGRDLFDFYCASCHGRDGRGGGHVASALKVPPPDLTTLAQRNKGAFPSDRVEAIVKGETSLSTTAHGSSEMPVWGPIFRALDSRDQLNEARIRNIVSHIRSMQVKARAAPAASPR